MTDGKQATTRFRVIVDRRVTHARGRKAPRIRSRQGYLEPTAVVTEYPAGPNCTVHHMPIRRRTHVWPRRGRRAAAAKKGQVRRSTTNMRFGSQTARRGAMGVTTREPRPPQGWGEKGAGQGRAGTKGRGGQRRAHEKDGGCFEDQTERLVGYPWHYVYHVRDPMKLWIPPGLQHKLWIP